MSNTQAQPEAQPAFVASPEETVRRVVVEVLDDDIWDLIEFSPELKLVEDLDLSSVDFVMIVDRLARSYGGAIDFVSWLRGMSRQQVLSLRIQDLVEFIAACAAQEPVDARPRPDGGARRNG